MMAKKVKQKAAQKPVKNHSQAPQSAKLSSFSEHIRELRRRILWVALVFVLTSALAYAYHEQLVQFVMRPLEGQKLIYLTPGGGFSFIFQITLYAGLIAAGPMLMYQLYAFVRPALPRRARRSATKVVSVALGLMLLGVAYGYFIAVPSALKFLSNFAGANILPSLTADSYLSFFLSYVAGLGVLFQLPLLLIFWHWIRPMTPGGLLKSERIVILFAFVAAALITPTPDIINQSMIAIPLILMYQGGVVAVLISIRRAKRQARVAAPSVTNEPARQLPGSSLATATTTAAVATQTAQAVPAQAKRLPRSIDGFAVPRQSQPAQPLASQRQLRIPERRAKPADSLVRQRPLLRIDGVSSV